MATAWRAMDSRAGGGPLSNGTRRTLTLAGQAGVPSDATAVVVNVTSVHPIEAGYVAVVPSGAGDPGVSTVNDAPGADVRSVWDARLVRGGSHPVIVNADGADPIPPGGTMDVQFGASGTPAAPRACLFNGAACGF